MARILKAGLLLALGGLCLFALLLAHKLSERVPAPAPRELFTIVNEQLNAFRASDFRSAYRHAATGVQHKFTLAQFEKMVLQNYPEMTRPRRVEFGIVKVEGANALVQVYFFAPDGSARSFLYNLINEDNAWKISDVEEMKGYEPNSRLPGTHA